MKQIKLLSTCLGLLFMTLGCQKEELETKPLDEVQAAELAKKKLTPLGACTPSFYIYQNSEKSLGNASTQRIVVGFANELTSEQKALFLTNYPNLDQVIYDSHSGSADVTVVSLKNVYDCNQVNEILTTLKQSPEVLYANPAFDDGDLRYIGITNQFLVNLKNESAITGFESLLVKTNTKVVEQLSSISYVVSADKYSQGNALDMANEFYQNLYARYSEPDFFTFAK